MIVYARVSLLPKVDQFPYEAPKKIQDEALKILYKNKSYLIDLNMMLLEIPFLSDEYKEISDFKKTNKEYYKNDLILYERKFTKQDIDEAEYYVLRIKNIVYSSSDNNEFAYCCNNKCFVVEQINSMLIETKSMKGKYLGFATNYRFVISDELKNILIKNQITNLNLKSVFTKRNNNTEIAYQLDTGVKIPAIADINRWKIYKVCESTNSIIYDSNYIDPLTITKEISKLLFDINITSDTFTELGSSEVIISKKFYKILTDLKIKGLKCEPVIIIE